MAFVVPSYCVERAAFATCFQTPWRILEPRTKRNKLYKGRHLSLINRSRGRDLPSTCWHSTTYHCWAQHPSALLYIMSTHVAQEYSTYQGSWVFYIPNSVLCTLFVFCGHYNDLKKRKSNTALSCIEAKFRFYQKKWDKKYIILMINTTPSHPPRSKMTTFDKTRIAHHLSMIAQIWSHFPIFIWILLGQVASESLNNAFSIFGAFLKVRVSCAWPFFTFYAKLTGW